MVIFHYLTRTLLRSLARSLALSLQAHTLALSLSLSVLLSFLLYICCAVWQKVTQTKVSFCVVCSVSLLLFVTLQWKRRIVWFLYRFKRFSFISLQHWVCFSALSFCFVMFFFVVVWCSCFLAYFHFQSLGLVYATAFAICCLLVLTVGFCCCFRVCSPFLGLLFLTSSLRCSVCSLFFPFW